VSRDAAIALGAGGASLACFHCGLPTDGARFCCVGCEAVSSFISGAGLDDYYRLRQSAPQRPADSAFESLALYDEPAMGARFVRDAGAGILEADLVLEGLTCAACAWLTEHCIARVPGVASARVNYSTRRAHVTWRAGEARASAIFEAVFRAGYKAWPFEEGRLALVRERERRTLLRRFLVAALGMMQVMMYAYPAYIATEAEIGAGIESLMRWSGLLLTIPVLCYSAAPFFRGAWRDLRAHRLGMDVPIALGLAAAFAASAVSTVRGGGAVYFDSVAMFVFLVMGGRYLEHLALDRAARALQRLAGLAPASAHRIKPGSEAIELVPAALLAAGDRVLVRGGDSIPADGIARDPATVSEALLSGESRPLRKQPGDAVIGGSVNCGDAFVFHVTHSGGDTVLSTLRRMMEAALAGRPRWVEMAERASSLFVGFILVAALAAFLAWLAIDPSRAAWIAISVLIVTCPCALSLATPIAMTVATGALARRNVVVTSARAIEALAAATDFVFDKTGTLTEGRPRLHEALLLGAAGEEACLALAAAIGLHSRHPLDHAFAQAAAGLDLPRLSARAAHPGLGIEAVAGNERVRLGRRDFVAALVKARPPVLLLEGEDTLVWLGGESGWAAVFRIGDALRDHARAAVDELRATGARLHLLTGDDREVALRVAGRLGIDEVESRATPARKQDYVRTLQLGGARVAAVGDGINDAPALGQADVSIAMGGGADLAQVRADAVLLSDSLSDLAHALRIARRTRLVIRQNLAWALGYNLLVVPLAFAGMVTPLVAAIGMSASSLLVVANALRVR
jgi:Cu2+-exporting ATPase